MIGPEIPKGLLSKKSNTDEIVMSDEEDDIGPKIPKDLLNKKSNSDEIVMSDEEDNIGPKIPQHVLEKKKGYKEAVLSDEEFDIGPQIPQAKTVGPEIPTDMIRQRHQEIVMSDEEAVETVYKREETKIRVNGPELPSEQEPSLNDYTPELPPDLIQKRRTVQTQPGRRRAPIGPSIPSEFLAKEDDDDIIGPSLPQNYDTEEASKYSTLHAIEERARQSRENLENKKENAGKIERPEWMLAPPEVDYLKTATSSKSRQFSNKPVGAVDSSSWTDTPEEKERKRRQGGGEKRKAEHISYSASETERKRAIEDYNKKERPLSLLEIHQQKKKKSKDPVEDVTKRAFDREKDLMAPRMMNSKQKKEMLRQSTQFSDRFGHGRGSFL